MAFDINKTNRRYFPELRFRVSPKVRDQLELLSQAHLSRSLSAYLEMLLNSVAAGQTDMVDILSRVPGRSVVTPAAPLPRTTFQPVLQPQPAALPSVEVDENTADTVTIFREWSRVVGQHLTSEFRAKVEELLPQAVVSDYTKNHTFPMLDVVSFDKVLAYAYGRILPNDSDDAKHIKVCRNLEERMYIPVQAWLNTACAVLEKHINNPQLVSDAEGNNLLVLLEELKFYTIGTYIRGDDVVEIPIGSTWERAQTRARKFMEDKQSIDD